jgi:hypothetical protein
MRRTLTTICCLGGLLTALVGCQSNKPLVRRPPLEEVYVLPPQDDPRFNDPRYVYDKKALNQYQIKPEVANPTTPGRGMGMPTMGPTMGNAPGRGF